MGNTFTVRLPENLARWLQEAAATAGGSQGSIIRQELEKARGQTRKPFLSLAGRIAGAPDLSSRKGFSKK